MPPMHRVLILYPPIVLSGHDRPSYTFPMGAGYIAAVLEQAKYEVRCLDAVAQGRQDRRELGGGLVEYGLSVEQMMDRVCDFNPDLIGISCQFSVQYNPTRALLTAVKSRYPQVITVLGGTHSSAQQKEVMEQVPVDYVVLSEGEETIVELLARLTLDQPVTDLDGLAWRDGDSIRINPRTRFINDLDSLPFPARHLFDMEVYFETQRGWGEYKGTHRLSTSNIGLPVFVPSLFERWTKQLPVDRLVDLGKRIAILVDFVQSVLQIKKAGLDHGWSSSGEVVGRPLKR